MKASGVRTALFVVSVLLGVSTAWHACLSQDVDMDMIGGDDCYSCANEPCDWHSVACDQEPNHKCSISASCCRGPGTGSGDCIQTAGVKQCVSAGCYSRPDEMCME